MIQEDYVSFEQAKALKGLGLPIRYEVTMHTFSEPWSSYEEEYEEIHYDKPIPPTLSLVQKWLREEHNLYMVFLPCIKDIMGDLSKCDYYKWKVVYNGSEPYAGISDTYEQALSAGIDKCISILKQHEFNKQQNTQALG